MFALRTAALVLCVQFNVGVIVVDEAQRMSGASSPAPEAAINELLYMRDGLGIPCVFCGTYRILELMDRDERLYRRASENGIFPIQFCPSPSDEHWEKLCQAYWDRLLLRHPGKLDKSMVLQLFEKAAGTPWALKELLQHAQRLALTEGKETLTPNLLEAVYRQQMMHVDPILQALNTGDPTALKRYEHMYHPLFDAREHRKAAKARKARQHVLVFSHGPRKAA